MSAPQVHVHQYFPTEIFRDSTGPLTIKSAFANCASGDNKTVVAGVSGKKLVILSYNVASTSTAGFGAFKTPSGGTDVWVIWVPANTLADPNVFAPFNPAGYFSTAAGDGLFINNGAAVAIYVSVQYVEVTP
jgi:hypothetical protein